MKRLSVFLNSLLFVLFSFGVAGATTHDIKPRQENLFHLDQLGYHTWDVVWIVPEDNNISASSLFHKFAGQDSVLYRWQYVLDTADANFEFHSAKVTAPSKDSADGNSGSGFDAETNNQSDGKTLSLEAAPDSKSAMFFLLASGLVGLAAFGRKLRRS